MGNPKLHSKKEMKHTLSLSWGTGDSLHTLYRLWISILRGSLPDLNLADNCAWLGALDEGTRQCNCANRLSQGHEDALRSLRH